VRGFKTGLPLWKPCC